jgi:hypothetical protein
MSTSCSWKARRPKILERESKGTSWSRQSGLTETAEAMAAGGWRGGTGDKVGESSPSCIELSLVKHGAQASLSIGHRQAESRKRHHLPQFVLPVAEGVCVRS